MKANDYDIKFYNVPADIPRDVLIEHLAVAVRKIQKGRSALKRVRIEIVEQVPTHPRQHPFDGPVVNDDWEPEYLANGGVVTPGAMPVVLDGGYVMSKEDAARLRRDAMERLRKLNQRDTVIFSGKQEDEPDQTVQLRGSIPVVPEYEPTIEIDVADIMPAIYQAITDDFPHLSELFRAKREEATDAREIKRPTEMTDPPGEGDWELDSGDHVGEDV